MAKSMQKVLFFVIIITTLCITNGKPQNNNNNNNNDGSQFAINNNNNNNGPGNVVNNNNNNINNHSLIPLSSSQVDGLFSFFTCSKYEGIGAACYKDNPEKRDMIGNLRCNKSKKWNYGHLSGVCYCVQCL